LQQGLTIVKGKKGGVEHFAGKRQHKKGGPCWGGGKALSLNCLGKKKRGKRKKTVSRVIRLGTDTKKKTQKKKG